MPQNLLFIAAGLSYSSAVKIIVYRKEEYKYLVSNSKESSHAKLNNFWVSYPGFLKALKLYTSGNKLGKTKITPGLPLLV